MNKKETKKEQKQRENAEYFAKKDARNQMTSAERSESNAVREQERIQAFAERERRQQSNQSAAESYAAESTASNLQARDKSIESLLQLPVIMSSPVIPPVPVRPPLPEGHSNRPTSKFLTDAIKSRKANVLTLTHQDDFEFEYMLIMAGHSNLDTDMDPPIELSNKDDPDGFKQVTILLGQPGVCTYGLYALNKMYAEDVPKWCTSASASAEASTSVISQILADLNDRFKTKEFITTDSEMRAFVKSVGYISNSPHSYREKNYDMFNSDAEGRPTSFFGGFKIIRKHDQEVVYSWDPVEGELKSFTKTELLGIAKGLGILKLLFIDLGCCGFSGEDAQALWAKIIKAGQGLNIGGTRRNKRKSRKRRVRKLCL
jgi:hypothetical protein